MKTFLIYLVELIIAAIMLWIDQRLFFLFAFIVAMYSIDKRFNNLAECVGALHAVDQTISLAIADHLNIPKEKIDIDSIYSQATEMLSQQQREAFKKGINVGF